MIIHARAKTPLPVEQRYGGAMARAGAVGALTTVFARCVRAAINVRRPACNDPCASISSQRKETPRINDPHRYSTSFLGRRAMPVRPSTDFADSRDPEQIAPPKGPFGAHNTIWLTSHRLTDSGAQMVPGNFAPMARTPMETSFRDEIKVGSKAITHTCALMQQTAFHLLAG